MSCRPVKYYSYIGNCVTFRKFEFSSTQTKCPTDKTSYDNESFDKTSLGQNIQQDEISYGQNILQPKRPADKTSDEGNVNILNVCKCLEVFSNSKDFKSHTFSRRSPVQKTELLKTGLVSHHTSSHC